MFISIHQTRVSITESSAGGIQTCFIQFESIRFYKELTIYHITLFILRRETNFWLPPDYKENFGFKVFPLKWRGNCRSGWINCRPFRTVFQRWSPFISDTFDKVDWSEGSRGRIINSILKSFTNLSDLLVCPRTTQNLHEYKNFSQNHFQIHKLTNIMERDENR